MKRKQRKEMDSHTHIHIIIIINRVNQISNSWYSLCMHQTAGMQQDLGYWQCAVPFNPPINGTRCASHLISQCPTSSTSPLSHNLHTLSSLATPLHLPASISKPAVPPLSFIIILLSDLLHTLTHSDHSPNFTILFNISTKSETFGCRVPTPKNNLRPSTEPALSSLDPNCTPKSLINTA